MKKRNQPTDIVLYAIDVFGWGLLTVFIYRTMAFKVIPGLSLTQSNWVFWGLWAVLLVAAFFATPPRCRTGLSVFASVNAPFGIYFILSYFRVYRTAIIVVLSVTGALLVAYTALVLVTNLPAIRAGRLRGKLGRFWCGFAHRLRVLVSMGLSVLSLVFCLSLFFGIPVLTPATVATDPKVNDQTIEKNMDTILLLQEETWATLGAQQRMDVLQTVANIEATYFGLPHELNVTAEALEESVQGHYDDTTHTIAVDVDHLAQGTAHDLVETIAHEAHHAYEWRLVDLYNSTGSQERNLRLFLRIEEYRSNFDNYVSGTDDLSGYISQAVEIDSIRYGLTAVKDYYEAIEEHLNPVT